MNKITIKKDVTNVILNSQTLSDEFYFNVRSSNGWDEKEKFVGICIQIHYTDKSIEKIPRFKNQIYGLLDRIFREKGYQVTETPDQIFLFCSIECIDSVEDIADKIIRFSQNNDDAVTLSFGISRIYNLVRAIPKMHNECYIASLFSKEGEVLYYDSLDTIKLLYSLKDDKQVLEYYERTIGKLKEYDRKNRGELLNTLESYFKYNMNKREVADKLHIHIETLRYRLNKIESLTGYSLSTSEGIFILQMNVKLHAMIHM